MQAHVPHYKQLNIELWRKSRKNIKTWTRRGRIWHYDEIA